MRTTLNLIGFLGLMTLLLWGGTIIASQRNRIQYLEDTSFGCMAWRENVIERWLVLRPILEKHRTEGCSLFDDHRVNIAVEFTDSVMPEEADTTSDLDERIEEIQALREGLRNCAPGRPCWDCKAKGRPGHYFGGDP